MKNINILSLFDGMSCGQLALNNLKHININKYYASEIDKHAINISKYNFPNTIHLGNVKHIDIKKLDKIDLLIGGSPCQNLSFAGKRNGMVTKEKIEITTLEQYLKLKKENFEFEGQSYLFWEYIRILRNLQKVNPNIKFLLENVVMTDKWRKIFNDTIGIDAILLNSDLVSAQNRNRLYWTNIKIDKLEDKKIKRQDILETNKDWNKASILGRRLNKDGVRKDNDKNIPIIQCLEVRQTNQDKCNCLTTVSKDNVITPLPIGRHPDVYAKHFNKEPLKYRHYTLVECCRLQTVPKDYFNLNIVSKSQALKMLGNGWTVDIISHILKNI